MPVNQQQPGGPTIYPGYTPTSVLGQLPGGHQAQQQLQPNQMSAFVGFPQQVTQQSLAVPQQQQQLTFGNYFKMKIN